MPEEEKQEAKQDWRAERREWRSHRRGHFLIPAGILIGLGIGLLFGQPAAGVLIGLGLGFLGSALIPAPTVEKPAPSPAPMWGPRWVPVIIGIFLVLVGLSIVGGLLLPWTYIFAVFLILVGIGFILRGFGWMR